MAKHKKWIVVTKIKCPVCKSKNFYWRLKTDSGVCRKCGCIFKVNPGETETYSILGSPVLNLMKRPH